MNESRNANRPARRYGAPGWFLLCLAVAAALALVAVPAWLIQPFAAQTPEGLEAAYAMRRWSPAVTLAVAAGGLALAAWLWRGARWWARAALVLLLAAAGAAAWMARQNHFEWMFNPLPEAAYARAAEASFVEDGDMVMAVEQNGDAVAYPVRLLAYHHVVQDTVGGVPVVATY